MATATLTPATKKASKLLARYTELAGKKAQLTDAYKKSVEELDGEMNELKTKLEVWSKENGDAFGTKKSIALDEGTFGYKLNAKAIAFPLDGPEDIQEQYQKLVKKELPAAIEEKVDSKKVLGALAHFPTLEKALAKLGIKAKQDESFYITPKK